MKDLSKKTVVRAEIRKCEAELKKATALFTISGIENDLEYLRGKLETAV